MRLQNKVKSQKRIFKGTDPGYKKLQKIRILIMRNWIVEGIGETINELGRNKIQKWEESVKNCDLGGNRY